MFIKTVDSIKTILEFSYTLIKYTLTTFVLLFIVLRNISLGVITK